MSTYVIGDIHGCYEEFQSFISRIDHMDTGAQYILVGDIIDRGPQSFEMLMWAMESCNQPDGKFTLLLGNHEYMKIAYLKHYLEIRGKGERNGLGDFMPDAYGFRDVLLAHDVEDEQIRRIVRFFSTLPVYLEKTYIRDGKREHYIIVHGDIPWYCLNKNETFSKRSLSKVYMPVIRNGYGRSVIEEIVWGRNEAGHPELKHTTIVHGHTPTNFLEMAHEIPYKGRICHRPHDINVDCGVVFKKNGDRYANLAALRLEDMEEFYFYI